VKEKCEKRWDGRRLKTTMMTSNELYCTLAIDDHKISSMEVKREKKNIIDRKIY
jgi:hypothetical protein